MPTAFYHTRFESSGTVSNFTSGDAFEQFAAFVFQRLCGRYGDSALAKRALAFRNRIRLSAKRNVAVAKFTDGSVKEFASEGAKAGSRHSEVLVRDHAKKHGLEVLELFTERTPCTSKHGGKSGGCFDLLLTDNVFKNMQTLEHIFSTAQQNTAELILKAMS